MHQQHRKKRDDAEEAVIEWIIHRLHQILRKNRHIGTSLQCDTQDASEVEKAVRQRWNRYVVFDGTNDLLKDIFSWTSNDGWRGLKSTLSDKAGQAGIVGGSEPTVRDSEKWGVSPVELSPPSWHHYDANGEATDDGWHARVRYGAGERLERPDWDTALPEDLEITATVDDEADEDDEAEAEEHPAKIEARYLKRNNPEMSVSDIREAIPNNPDTGNPYSRSAVHGWIEHLYD
jgi:hypothetical protein